MADELQVVAAENEALVVETMNADECQKRDCNESLSEGYGDKEYFSNPQSKLQCRAALSFMEVKSIVAASFGDNDRRCYKVHWKDSWIYEDHLFGCEEVIAEFWKKREEMKEQSHMGDRGNDALASSDKDDDDNTNTELTVIVLREDRGESGAGMADEENDGENNVVPDWHIHRESNGSTMKEIEVGWKDDDTKENAQIISKRNHCTNVDDDGKENQVVWDSEDMVMKANMGQKRRDILTCHICGDSFDMVSAIRRHYTTNHPGNKPFACESCGKRFDRKENLNRHIRIHTGDRRYVCKHCTKGYTDPSGLKKHILSKHSSSIFPCQFCKATFKSKDSMNRHLTKHLQDYKIQKEDTFNVGIKRTIADENDTVDSKVFLSNDHTLNSKTSISLTEAVCKNNVDNNDENSNVSVIQNNDENFDDSEAIEVQYIHVSQEESIPIQTEEDKSKTNIENEQYSQSSTENAQFVLPITTEQLLKLTSDAKTLPLLSDHIKNIATEHLKLMTVTTEQGRNLPIPIEQIKDVPISTEQLKCIPMSGGESFLTRVSNSTGEELIAVSVPSPQSFTCASNDKLPSSTQVLLPSNNEINENAK